MRRTSRSAGPIWASSKSPMRRFRQRIQAFCNPRRPPRPMNSPTPISARSTTGSARLPLAVSGSGRATWRRTTRPRPICQERPSSAIPRLATVRGARCCVRRTGSCRISRSRMPSPITTASRARCACDMTRPCGPVSACAPLMAATFCQTAQQSAMRIFTTLPRPMTPRATSFGSWPRPRIPGKAATRRFSTDRGRCCMCQAG